MKGKIKNQKGFIPLIVIIITSLVVVSAGVVLYKQGKLAPLTANISEVFKGKTTEIETIPKAKPQLEETEQPQLELESNQEEISKQRLEEARLEIEKAKQEAERTRLEAEKAKAEIERLKKEAEAKRLADLQKQKEEEARKIAEDEARAKAEQELQQQLEAQRKAEEEATRKAAEEAQRKAEEKAFQEIKSEIDYYSRQLALLESEIEQTANSFKRELESDKTQYLNQIDWSESIYKPEMERLHDEILNEATKGLWTDCMWLKELWDYQNAYYNQYSTGLNNAERTLKVDCGITADEYFPKSDHYQDLIYGYKKGLEELSKELSYLSISESNKEALQNEITSLEKKTESLNSIAIKEVGEYNVPYPTSQSKLSVVENLMEIEKNYFADTSCRNLPR